MAAPRTARALTVVKGWPGRTKRTASIMTIKPTAKRILVARRVKGSSRRPANTRSKTVLKWQIKAATTVGIMGQTGEAAQPLQRGKHVVGQVA